MVDVIDDFLQTISKRLVHYYKADVSSSYLERMTDHLKTFFDDITGELEDRSTALQTQIEGSIAIGIAVFQLTQLYGQME